MTTLVREKTCYEGVDEYERQQVHRVSTQRSSGAKRAVVTDLNPHMFSVRVRQGVFKMARNSAQLWFTEEMLSETDHTIKVALRASHLDNENIRERVISLIGNTPGFLQLVEADLASGADHPREAGMILQVVHDDNAESVYGNPWENAEKARDILSR